MNHAVTLGEILVVIGCIVGLLAAALGALMFMAGGMSDSPSAGDRAGKQGCIVAIVGIILLCASIYGCVR